MLALGDMQHARLLVCSTNITEEDKVKPSGLLYPSISLGTASIIVVLSLVMGCNHGNLAFIE